MVTDNARHNYNRYWT